MDETQKRNAHGLEAALVRFLRESGEDPTRDGLHETPARFVRQLKECLIGYAQDPHGFLKVFDNDGYEDLIIVRDISFSSLCEHHMLPFIGTIDVAYLPSQKILGLSKFARLADAISKRLQVQERITKQLADLLETSLKPHLLIVHVAARHMCMGVRGVRRPHAVTDTMIVRGDSYKHRHYIERFNEAIKGNGKW